jgi:glutathione peroxidase
MTLLPDSKAIYGLTRLGTVLRTMMAMAAITPALYAAHSVFDFSLVSLEGKNFPLKQYEGKVLLIVNVASQSEFNDQIAKLETLYEKYQVQGLVVLAIPCNDFGAEEPEPANEVGKSYAGFHLKFPLLGKASVIGKDQLPLYKFLATPKSEGKKAEGDAASTEKAPPAEVPWNFSKYLISRKGQPISRFDADVAPDSPALMAAVEDALKPKAEPDDKATQRARTFVPRPSEPANRPGE